MRKLKTKGALTQSANSIACSNKEDTFRWSETGWIKRYFLCLPCANPRWIHLPGWWGRWWLMHCKIKRHISQGPKQNKRANMNMNNGTWVCLLAKVCVHVLLLTAAWPLLRQGCACAECMQSFTSVPRFFLVYTLDAAVKASLRRMKAYPCTSKARSALEERGSFYLYRAATEPWCPTWKSHNRET